MPDKADFSTKVLWLYPNIKFWNWVPWKSSLLSASVFSSQYFALLVPLLCDVENRPLSGQKDLNIGKIKFFSYGKSWWNHKEILEQAHRSLCEVLSKAHQERRSEGEIARSLVYSFKSGESQEIVAQETAKRLKETFGEKVEELVFTCIPASSAEKNEARYKAFSERVCELTGAINAYDHIKVSGERLAVHENRKVSEKKITKVQVIEFDEDFFKGKNCICFDDVLTSGKKLGSLRTS